MNIMHIVGAILPEINVPRPDVFLLASRDGKADFGAM
jgi:hypothetical protein